MKASQILVANLTAVAVGLFGALLVAVLLAPPTSELATSVLADDELKEELQDRLGEEAKEIVPSIVPDRVVDEVLEAAWATGRFDPVVEDVVEGRIDFALGRSDGSIEVELSDLFQLDGILGLLSSPFEVVVPLPPEEGTPTLRGPLLLLFGGFVVLWAGAAVFARRWAATSGVGLGIGIVAALVVTTWGQHTSLEILDIIIAPQRLMLTAAAVCSVAVAIAATAVIIMMDGRSAEATESRTRFV